MARSIHIDVISDTVCPWCYVGKKNLDKALELAVPPAKKGEVSVNVDWRPFLLSKPDVWREFGPEAEKKGVDKRAFYDMKFGPGRWLAFMPRLEAAFEQAGVKGFNMDGKTGPTVDSHRLIWWGKKLGKQDAIVEELFKAYFINGQPLCDLDVLTAAAERVGFPEPRKFLESQEGKQEVEEELKMAVKERVSGVPFFIISDGKNRVTLSGAQPPEVIADAMQNFLDD